MGEVKKGSEAAKETGLALAQIYNHIRAGRVKNHLKGGWPEGKGVEVDMDELRAAIASSGRRPKGSGKASGGGASVGRRKATKADTEAMHDALDEEEAQRRARKRASGEDGNTVRLVRRDRSQRYPVCPVNPSHGELAPAERDAKAKKGDAPKLQCWHQEHDGRPRNHPAGLAVATQFVFTEEEAQIAQPSGTLGVVMLNWIASGRVDLAESLEKWMEKNSIEVWIPVR